MFPRHKRLADEYLVDLHETNAAIRAGYTGQHLCVTARRIMRRPDVQEYIKQRMMEREIRTEVTQDMVIKELANIAFADPRSVMSWGPDGVILIDSQAITREQAAIVSEVAETKDGVRLKTHSKMQALELLGKHMGMFKDRVEVTGKDGAPLQQVNMSVDEFAKIAKEVAQDV